MIEKYIKLRDEFCADLEPKVLTSAINQWEFYINSTDENLKKMSDADEEVYKLYRNQTLYNELKSIYNSDIKDEHLKRQLKDLIQNFDDELNSGDLKKELRDKENQIAAKYNSYIMTIDEKETTLSEINKILQTEKDVNIRKKAYCAKTKAGDLIADDLVEFVKLRNKFALTKGYNNYFQYALKEFYNIDFDYLEQLLDDVYNDTKKFCHSIIEKRKQEYSEEYNISVDELKAYHYGLLLESNPAKKVNESLVSKEQVVDIAKKTYLNMGYDIDNLPITLDLFPRKNKNTHGFCFDIDAGKDARVLANLTNNTYSVDTLMHELGHCVYTLGIDTKLPYLDRNTHPAMTEAVAMMMGDLKQSENVLSDFVPKDVLIDYKNDFKNSEVNFITKSLLIINFERMMYENPSCDLKKLWHDLSCKYLERNEDDVINNEWATIPHYLSHPGYYQNYFRADLIKAQIYYYLRKNLGNITENKNTAEFLDKNLFSLGMSLEEDDLIKKFTGEGLSTKAFCKSLGLN